MVRFMDHVDLMEECEPGRVFLGLDRKNEPFYGSFNIDDPHWGASCTSGRGKSTWLQVVAAQILHNDHQATLDGIDPKGNSLTPLIGIPGVAIACDPLGTQEMWDQITTTETEMMERLAILKSDPTAEFPVKLLFIDECNTFAGMSKQYWATLKEKSDPVTPPVWGLIARILWMGRAANIHIVIVGQRLDDRATGGIGLRDSLGFRAVAGFRANQYRMLIGDGVAPKSHKEKGRWLYSDGLTETWIQNAYATPNEIRDYARENRKPAIDTTPVPGTRVTAPTRESVSR
jgi:DNA segregation ATPase FtsK/SpoIIIE-like protein